MKDKTVIAILASILFLAVTGILAFVYWDSQQVKPIPEPISAILPTQQLAQEQASPPPPPPTPTAEPSSVYLPIIDSGPGPNTSPKKGVYLGSTTCDAMERMGISWYYVSGHQCEGYEYIEYLGGWREMPRAIEGTPDLSNETYVMFLNECDHPIFICPDVETQVQALVELEKMYPDIIWVGPCSAGISHQYIIDFWTYYEQLTGHKPDPVTHRMCQHCYGQADHCISNVWGFQQVGLQFGLDKVWVTEYGALAGETLNFTQVNENNERFTNWMLENPTVERFAYWAAHYQPGHWAPGNYLTGWHPLVYDYINQDALWETRLTVVGEWYRTVGE